MTAHAPRVHAYKQIRIKFLINPISVFSNEIQNTKNTILTFEINHLFELQMVKRKFGS
jgi:hypothetical protein